MLSLGLRFTLPVLFPTPHNLYQLNGSQVNQLYASVLEFGDLDISTSIKYHVHHIMWA